MGIALGDVAFRARHEVTAKVMKRIISRYRTLGDPGIVVATDPAIAAYPYDYYAELRAQGPMVKGATGVVVLTSHELIEGLYRDPRMGHPPVPTPEERANRSIARKLLEHNPFEGMQHPLMPPSMIVVNPPDHTRYRKLVSRAFTVRKAEEMRPRIKEIALGLLKDMGDRPDMDVMRDFASALPVMVIAEILGVPSADQANFRKWGYDVARTLDINLTFEETRDARDSLRALNDYFTEVFEQRRRDPQPDLVTALIEAEVDGDRLSPDELMANVLILLVAGFETTVNLLGNGTHELMKHPEMVQRLLASPDLWPNAVDEMLRFDSPVQFSARYSNAEVEIAGESFPAGTTVYMLIGSANRDEAVFADADTFDIERTNANRHVAFSSGIHFCPGAALARIEGQIGLQALFETFPDLAPAGPGKRRGSPLLRGFDSLPVRIG